MLVSYFVLSDVARFRTPIGKAYRGAFNDTQAQALGGHVIKHAVERAMERALVHLRRSATAGDEDEDARAGESGGIIYIGCS